MSSRQDRSRVIRFGVYEADVSAGELWRSGVKIRLQDLPFRTLALLLSRPGEVVTREELRQALWPADVYVDFEQGISSAVMRVRDALRDSADNPVFIETIERRGYRWIGPIQFPEAVPNTTPEQKKEATQEVAKPLIVARASSRRLPWRKLLYAIPVLILLYAVSFFRMARKVDAGSKAAVVPASVAHSSNNAEAEELYLKGRYYWNKRTPESLNLAVDAFTQAIARDPKDADAYVGLADCYNLLREFSVMPPNEAYLKAFSAAKKAVELNPQSADAHASLAFVTFWGMWDARDAEQEFRRAVELDPNNSKAHHWFATFLQVMNRGEEAIVQIEAAQKLDPHSSSILADKGRILWAAGRHDEGLQLLKQTEEAEPEFSSPHRYLRMAYFETHDYPRYLAEWKKEAQVRHDAVQLAAEEAAARGYSTSGERGLLEAELSYQAKLYRDGKSSPYPAAQAEAVLGNRSEALRYLSLCVQSHDELSLSIAQDPSLASLHDDPEYKRLLSIIGVPQSE